MRSRHILGYLAENIARATCRRAGCVARPGPGHCPRGRLGNTPPLPSQACTLGSRSFTASASARTDAKRPLPEHARHVLRHLSNSVVVCTAHAGDAAQAVDGTGDDATAKSAATTIPVGLTMSSFTSLSLYPTPVVTFNIAVPSRTEAAIARTRHFVIHVLSGDEEGARVADVFRVGNAHPSSILNELQRSGCSIVRPSAAADGPKDSEPPFLQGPGVLYVLRCRLLAEPFRGLVPVRDHIVVLGEVLDITAGEAATTDAAGSPRFGLLYGDQNYRQPDGRIITTGDDQKP